MVNVCRCEFFGYVQHFRHIHSVILNWSSDYSSIEIVRVWLAKQTKELQNITCLNNFDILN